MAKLEGFSYKQTNKHVGRWNKHLAMFRLFKDRLKVNLCWSKSTGDRSLDEAVQDHVDELTNLTNVSPDLGLNGGVHLHLFDGQGDQLVQDVCDLWEVRNSNLCRKISEKVALTISLSSGQGGQSLLYQCWNYGELKRRSLNVQFKLRFADSSRSVLDLKIQWLTTEW